MNRSVKVQHTAERSLIYPSNEMNSAKWWVGMWVGLHMARIMCVGVGQKLDFCRWIECFVLSTYKLFSTCSVKAETISKKYMASLPSSQRDVIHKYSLHNIIIYPRSCQIGVWDTWWVGDPKCNEAYFPVYGTHCSFPQRMPLYDGQNWNYFLVTDKKLITD